MFIIKMLGEGGRGKRLARQGFMRRPICHVLFLLFLFPSSFFLLMFMDIFVCACVCECDEMRKSREHLSAGWAVHNIGCEYII